MPNIDNIVKQLKSRKVFRSLAIYAAFAFVLIQVCSIVFPALYLPEWTMTFLVVLVIIGFPTTLVLSWIYDITPSGDQEEESKKTKDGTSETKSDRSLYKDLMDRRFPHIIICYIIICWGSVSLVSYVVKESMLSPNLTSITLFGMISLFPTIFMLAYFHGKKGLKDFEKIEKIGIPLNLTVSAIFLFVMFFSIELGAVTQTVRFENEEGQMTERIIPKAAFIKKLGIFFFKNESGDLDIDWMHHGFVEGLGMTLNQDLFIEENIPVGDMGGWFFYKKLRDAGFEDGRGSPFAFKQELSNSLHQDAFLTGSYFRENNEITVKASLYDSQKGKLISEHKYTSDNIFHLIDSLSHQIRYDLNLPERHINESKFLSVRDLLTNSYDAFKYQIKGQIAWNVHSDNDKCMKHIEKSVELDSTNPWTRWILAENYMFSDQKDKAIEQYKGGFKYLYKFPESFSFTFKKKYYLWVEKNPDKAFKLTKMNAEMNPENKDAQIRLGRSFLARYMLDDALRKFKDLYQMYPDDHDFLNNISYVYRKAGDFESALHYTDQYVSIYSDESNSYEKLGSIYAHFGFYNKAIDNYEKALLIDPNNINYLSSLSYIKLAFGIFEGALKICNEMLELSTSPEHISYAYDCLHTYHEARGEIRTSIEMIEKNIDVIKEHDFINFHENWLMAVIAYRHTSIGQFDKALEILQTIDEEMVELFKDRNIFNYVKIYYELKDVNRLQALIKPMEKLIESDPYHAHKEKLYHTKGLINELEGNYVGAIVNHKKANDFNKTALPQLIGLARCHRLNGESKKARKFVDMALQLYPFDGEVRYESALIYTESGQINKAKEEIEIVLNIWSAADNDHIKSNKAKKNLAELNKQF